MAINDLIQIAKLFPKERRVKAIKVSKEFYEYIKKNFGTPDDLIAKAPIGYKEHLGSIPIVIDDDVETWKVEYWEDKDV